MKFLWQHAEKGVRQGTVALKLMANEEQWECEKNMRPKDDKGRRPNLCYLYILNCPAAFVGWLWPTHGPMKALVGGCCVARSITFSAAKWVLTEPPCVRALPCGRAAGVVDRETYIDMYKHVYRHVYMRIHMSVHMPHAQNSPIMSWRSSATSKTRAPMPTIRKPPP